MCATFGDRVFISATGNKHKIQRWRDVSPFPDVFVFSDFKVCSRYLHVLTGKNLIQQSLVTIFCVFPNWRFDRKLLFIPTIFIDTFNVLPRVLVARAVHYSKLVSLRNRTEEENGKTPVCKKTWQGYYLRVLSWSALTINIFWSFTKRSVYRKVKFGGKLFETKLLSRLSHKVCRLLSTPVLLRKFTII